MNFSPSPWHLTIHSSYLSPPYLFSLSKNLLRKHQSL